MRYHGQITSWKDEKGFGFITPTGGKEQVFVHIKAFSNRARRPVGNEAVTYELVIDPKGRAQAANVIFIGDGPLPDASQGEWRGAFIIATLFIGSIALLVLLGKLPPVVLALYVVASILTYHTYKSDKSAAKSSQWRTSESTLHLLGLVGGWPGAFVAQKQYRHKIKKESFQATYWVTVVMNCGVLGWFLTPQGSEALRSLLSIRT